MIKGWIDSRDTTARLPVRLTGPKGAHDLVFEVDTGFFGSILIPMEWADLMVSGYDPVPQAVFLADGTPRATRVCYLRAEWLGGPRNDVEVLAVAPPVATPGSTAPASPFAKPGARDRHSGKPHGLIGRGLLVGTCLLIDWVGDEVVIAALLADICGAQATI